MLTSKNEEEMMSLGKELDLRVSFNKHVKENIKNKAIFLKVNNEENPFEEIFLVFLKESD